MVVEDDFCLTCSAKARFPAARRAFRFRGRRARAKRGTHTMRCITRDANRSPLSPPARGVARDLFFSSGGVGGTKLARTHLGGPLRAFRESDARNDSRQSQINATLPDAERTNRPASPLSLSLSKRASPYFWECWKKIFTDVKCQICTSSWSTLRKSVACN